MNVAQYIFNGKEVSRNDIAQACGISMPTTLARVNELMTLGIVEEKGEQESSGGRKAKVLSLVGDAAYAIGINVSRTYVEMVLVGLDGSLVSSARCDLEFRPEAKYFSQLREEVEHFIEACGKDTARILGVGFSVPGVLSSEKTILTVSHVLGVENFALSRFAAVVDYPACFENDANCAALSEEHFRNSTAFYLSLNYTLGGAFSVDGELYNGLNFKSSEVGHWTLVPDGRPCYCGHYGCADSYCAAKQLLNGDLDHFFEKLRAEDPETVKTWKEYVKYLGLTINNIRTLLDCDVILGGYVGGYLKPYMEQIEREAMRHNNFDLLPSFIHRGECKWEASAIGGARNVIDRYLQTM